MLNPDARVPRPCGFLARFGAGAKGRLSRFARQAVDLVYPPQCVACDVRTAEPHALCPACWREVAFIAPPFCARLGSPFAVDFGPGMLSPAAIADPPRFDSARAVARHDGLAKTMVTRLKYGERLDLARVMGGMMVAAGGEWLREDDPVLLPVPMHRGRLWQRRYNQAALLAVEIGRRTGLPVEFDALRRVRPTASQVGLKREARRQNLAGAFAVAPEAGARLAGRRAIVIDDVRTTGATANACAHLLRKAGFRRIDLLTFTLVPEGES